MLSASAASRPAVLRQLDIRLYAVFNYRPCEAVLTSPTPRGECV